MQTGLGIEPGTPMDILGHRSQGPLIIVVADCEKLPNKPEDDTPDKSGYFVNYYCENGWA